MPILELESKFRSALRAAAHSLHPLVQIGEKGLSEAVLLEIDRALNAHGLIKIRAGGEDRAARAAIQTTICEQLGCAPVHHLGKVLVLYRPTEGDPLARKLLGDMAPTSVAALGVQPRKADEPHVPKKLAADGKPAPARRRVERDEERPRPSGTARERYLGTSGREPRLGTRATRDALRGRRSPARPGSALSLRAGARRAVKK